MPTIDPLRLVTDALRADSAVAALVGDRVFTVLPRDKAFPLVRVTRIGGGIRPLSVWIDDVDLQIDAWGDTQRQAYDVARCLLEALLERLPGSRPGGVVTAVSASSIVAELDTDYAPPKHRARLDVRMTAHPQLSAASF